MSQKAHDSEIKSSFPFLKAIIVASIADPWFFVYLAVDFLFLVLLFKDRESKNIEKKEHVGTGKKQLHALD